MNENDNPMIVTRERFTYASGAHQFEYAYNTARGFCRTLEFFKSACVTAEKHDFEENARLDFVKPYKLAYAVIAVAEEYGEEGVIDLVCVHFECEGRTTSANMQFDSFVPYDKAGRLAYLTLVLQEHADKLHESIEVILENYG